MKKVLSFIAALAFSLSCFVFPAQAEEKIKVACVGDSITEGWASTDLNTQSYPAHLKNLLGDGYDVRNFGIGGRTAMKVAQGMTPYWNESFFAQSKSFNPDVVILMLGTNDVVTDNWNDGATYYPDLKALVEVYQGLPSSPTVYLATPSTAFDAAHPEKLQNKAVPIVKQVAEETGATLVDINALTANNGKYYPDGIHPNDEGYYRLALMFYENVFKGEVFDLTVKTEANAVIHSGELSAVADAEGKAVIPAVKGKVSFTVNKSSGGFVKAFANVDADKEVDATSLVFAENLASSATVTDDKGSAVTQINDANLDTGWQSTNGDYSNLWIKLDLGSAKDINSVSLTWEESTRAKKDKYVIEYSADGTNFVSVSNPVFGCSGSFDTVTFDSVNAQYIKLTIKDGVSGKVRPKLFEMGVYSAADEAEVAAVTDGDVSSEAEEQDKNNSGNGWLYMGIAAAIIIVIVLAIVLAKRKK